MKRVLLFIGLLCSCIAQSQEDRIPVAIFPFVSASEQDRGRAFQIQALVVDILQGKSNIHVIDRSQDTLLMKELRHQIIEQSMAASGLVEQGKVMGARHMLVGTLSNVRVEQKSKLSYDPFKKITGTVVEYSATLSFALQVSDVETGRMIKYKSFSGQKGLFDILTVGLGVSPEDAIIRAIAANKRGILSWINETYPPLIKILAIESRDRKGFPETLMISGLDPSLQKGTRLAINEVLMVNDGNGKPLRRIKRIGSLKIVSVEGDVIICRLIDGEKIIEEKINTKAKMELDVQEKSFL